MPKGELLNSSPPLTDVPAGPRQRVSEMQAKLHRWAVADSSRRFEDLFNLAAPRKRPVISPVKPGGTRREVPGSDG
jgi:RNA-directed DNA polymerase